MAAGVVALVGLAAFAAVKFLPPILAGIPDLEITPDLLKAIPLETATIGVVMLASAYLLYSRRERPALVVMVVLMAGLAVFNVREFANFDAITSSKKMVAQLVPWVGDDCVWISEGSDEVGAAAGTAYYIRQFTTKKDARVLIMNVDPKRPEPKYPGEPLSFFINQKQLDELWEKDAPTLYVTDFKRTDWDSDKPTLPSHKWFDLFLKPEVSGHRHVYANPAAWAKIKDHLPQQ